MFSKLVGMYFGFLISVTSVCLLSYLFILGFDLTDFISTGNVIQANKVRVEMSCFGGLLLLVVGIYVILLDKFVEK